jgi:protein translocase SecG subunit
MSVFIVFLYAVVVVLSLLLIGLVLIQPAKSGGMGAAFGGIGESVFGAKAGSHLTKATVVMTTLFFVLTLTLAALIGRGYYKTKSNVAAKLEAGGNPKVNSDSGSANSGAEQTEAAGLVAPQVEVSASQETDAKAVKTPDKAEHSKKTDKPKADKPKTDKPKTNKPKADKPKAQPKKAGAPKAKAQPKKADAPKAKAKAQPKKADAPKAQADKKQKPAAAPAKPVEKKPAATPAKPVEKKPAEQPKKQTPEEQKK